MHRGSTGLVDGLGAFYTAKPASYFSNARADFIDRLPRNSSASVLEIGCGTGATGALALSEGCCGRYVGVEPSEAAATEAREVLSEVICADVETTEFAWQPAEFDAVILSEVLEQLVEPSAVLRRLAPHVRQGGILLASSPNISHWRVIRELILGHFNLTGHGVFDRTHLRWFTPHSFATMIEAAGFAIQEIGPVTAFSSRAEVVSLLTGGRFDHLMMSRIAVMAVKR